MRASRPHWPAVPALGFSRLARLLARRSVHGCICQSDAYRKSPPPCCKRHGSLGSAVRCAPVAAAAPHCWSSTALRPMPTAHGIRAAIRSTKQRGGRRAAAAAAGAGCTVAGSGRPESSAPAAGSSRWRMQSRSTRRFSRPTSAMSTRQVLRHAGAAAACAPHWVEERLRASRQCWRPACSSTLAGLCCRAAVLPAGPLLLPLQRLCAPVPQSLLREDIASFFEGYNLPLEEIRWAGWLAAGHAAGHSAAGACVQPDTAAMAAATTIVCLPVDVTSRFLPTAPQARVLLGALPDRPLLAGLCVCRGPAARAQPQRRIPGESGRSPTSGAAWQLWRWCCASHCPTAPQPRALA